MVISADPAFVANLHEVAANCGWNFRDAPNVGDALPMLLTESIPLVVYDGQESDEWQPAFDKLRQLDSDRCLLLASPAPNPYLWQEVIRFGGFDLLSRTASRDEVTRKLMFAWFSTENTRKQEP